LIVLSIYLISCDKEEKTKTADIQRRHEIYVDENGYPVEHTVFYHDHSISSNTEEIEYQATYSFEDTVILIDQFYENASIPINELTYHIIDENGLVAYKTDSSNLYNNKDYELVYNSSNKCEKIINYTYYGGLEDRDYVDNIFYIYWDNKIIDKIIVKDALNNILGTFYAEYTNILNVDFDFLSQTPLNFTRLKGELLSLHELSGLKPEFLPSKITRDYLFYSTIYYDYELDDNGRVVKMIKTVDDEKDYMTRYETTYEYY
jgi:hypothetical protein